MATINKENRKIVRMIAVTPPQASKKSARMKKDFVLKTKILVRA